MSKFFKYQPQKEIGIIFSQESIHLIEYRTFPDYFNVSIYLNLTESGHLISLQFKSKEMVNMCVSALETGNAKAFSEATKQENLFSYD